MKNDHVKALCKYWNRKQVGIVYGDKSAAHVMFKTHHLKRIKGLGSGRLDEGYSSPQNAMTSWGTWLIAYAPKDIGTFTKEDLDALVVGLLDMAVRQ